MPNRNPLSDLDAILLMMAGGLLAASDRRYRLAQRAGAGAKVLAEPAR